jgi:hypothetical protein
VLPIKLLEVDTLPRCLTFEGVVQEAERRSQIVFGAINAVDNYIATSCAGASCNGGNGSGLTLLAGGVAIFIVIGATRRPTAFIPGCAVGVRVVSIVMH